MRVREIDTFRGLSILLMVFFTMIFRLSRELPDFILHNMRNSVHLGDFVLPMFLFASGMSIVFFVRKRENKKPGIFTMDVAGRFGKLAMIAFFLSPFSAGEALGMDEVMLSALLFIPSVALARTNVRTIAAVMVVVLASYFVLAAAEALPDFTEHYLGGYESAVFYLPVMLAGVVAGKMLDRTKELMIAFLAVAVVLMFVVPPYKMSLSPSFMMLSAAVSLMVFEVSKKNRCERMEYLGRKPIRYWVLMFILMVIPLSMYEVYADTSIPLGLGAEAAFSITLLLLPAIYIVSRGIDFFIPGR
jgi:predicted acyltransferase